MPGSKISQRVRALQLAHDCAALGARIRTIHHLTGLRPRELLYLLFNAHAMPPCGRAPNSREWYHNANLLQRIEASVVIANFQRMRHLGFPAPEALVGAYRYYQSMYRPPPRISFDTALPLLPITRSTRPRSAPHRILRRAAAGFRGSDRPSDACSGLAHGCQWRNPLHFAFIAGSRNLAFSAQ